MMTFEEFKDFCMCSLEERVEEAYELYIKNHGKKSFQVFAEEFRRNSSGIEAANCPDNIEAAARKAYQAYLKQ